MAFATKGEKMKEYKRTDINKNLWVLDYGDDKFEVYLRAWGPLGAFVYRYEKGRLKWYQRRSYSGVSSVKYFNFYK
jgi:hypothetical protein